MPTRIHYKHSIQQIKIIILEEKKDHSQALPICETFQVLKIGIYQQAAYLSKFKFPSNSKVHKQKLNNSVFDSTFTNRVNQKNYVLVSLFAVCLLRPSVFICCIPVDARMTNT